MSYATYDIWLRSAAGQRLQLIDSNTLLSLSFARSIYGEGAMEITTTCAYPFAYITQDGQLEVYRFVHQDGTTIGGTAANLSYILLEDGTNLLLEDGTNLSAEDYSIGGAPVSLPGSVTAQLLTDTVFLINRYSQEIQGGSLPFYRIAAEPFVSITKRRVVANAADSAQASKTAKGDDMMKAIMREQFGASATDVTRDLSAYLAIDADTGAGVSMSKAFARRNVYTVLQEIMQAQAQAGTRIYFDITYDTTLGKATFRTYSGQRGADHSRTSGAPVTFSYQRDNMQNPSLTYDFTAEINYVYALGQGTGAERLQATASDATRMAVSVYNRREDAYDARSFSAVAGLGDEANSALWAGRPRRNINGTLLSIPDTTFGIHWGLGDLVSAEFGTVQQDCIVESISIQLNNGAEVVTGVARGVN